MTKLNIKDLKMGNILKVIDVYDGVLCFIQILKIEEEIIHYVYINHQIKKLINCKGIVSFGHMIHTSEMAEEFILISSSIQ